MVQNIKEKLSILDKDEAAKRMLDDEEKKLADEFILDEDTTCGFWIFRGSFLQKFANKNSYVFLYGLVGCLFSATYAYNNGTITTLEKRYKIPSRNTGIISVGNDISTLILSAILSYYAGKGNRPRWIAFGLFTIVMFCFMNTIPHLMYGPGESALTLTTEFGATYNENQTKEIIEEQQRKVLCRINSTGGAECEISEGNIAPQVILFVSQLVSGIGGSLYFTLGVTYMDDNIKKSKTPALISMSYFFRMLGPAVGYSLASYCLKMYISPTLTPTIQTKDPRWLGAWWLGWIILGSLLLFFSFFMAMFPKTLPRAAIRKKIQEKMGPKTENNELPASFKDMMLTFKRLLKNKIYMLNNMASVFYFFGYMPYWIFTPKYIESQYKQSASVSSLVTGTVALVFSAFGVLLSGIIISKFKPRARYMAAWNVMVGALSVMGMITYAYLGCVASENSVIVNYSSETDLIPSCNSNCHCDYVKYSPICGEDGKTYISACHAGCETSHQKDDLKVFEQCSCITSKNSTIESQPLPFNETNLPTSLTLNSFFDGGKAVDGPCPINCQKEFIIFLVVMCFIKFAGATGRASNFLVSVRCVDEKDKSVSMGLEMMLLCLMAFIPSPIFFGMVLDATCLVWGKTCTGKGNCWLYDGEALRYLLNFTAAGFVLFGTLFDCGVWYYVKDLKIFDDEINNEEFDRAEKEDEVTMEKHTI